MSTDKAQGDPKSFSFGGTTGPREGYDRAPAFLPNFELRSVKLKKIREDVELPIKGTAKAAAYDVFAAKDVTVEAGRVAIVPLGFSIALPEGYDLKILSRSGNPKNRGLFIANSVGLVDEDYRDEVGVLVEYRPNSTYKVIEKLYKSLTTFTKNLTSAQQFVLDDARKRLLDAVEVKPFPPLQIKKGERIAQIQLNKVIPMEFVEVDELDETSREGGFGSTGV